MGVLKGGLNLKINKLSATLLALFIFICCASITIFAIEGDNSGTGNGAIKVSSSKKPHGKV